MSGGTWRDSAKPIIAKVIAEVGTDDPKRLKAALRDAYPWGPREHHPYKMWCDEIRVQLGLKVVNDRKAMPKVVEPSIGQRDLFEEST